MTKRIVHTVFMHETGVYEAYLIDRENNIVGGYLLFGAYGKSNPYRTFPIADCRIEKV